MKSDVTALLQELVRLVLRLVEFSEYIVRRSMRQDAAICALANAALRQDGAAKVMEILTGSPVEPDTIPIAMDMLVPEPVRAMRVAKAQQLSESEKARRQRIIKISEILPQLRELRKRLEVQKGKPGQDNPTL